MNKYRSASGKLLVRELFWEISLNKDYALYSLSRQDKERQGKVYPSIYRLFIEANDPEEYTFANTYFDSWDHWKQVRSSYAIKDHYASMREDLETKFRSEAVAAIIKASKGTGPQAVSAAKYIAEKGWEKATKGRPSKAAVQQEAIRIAEEEHRVESDLDRLLN